MNNEHHVQKTKLCQFKTNMNCTNVKLLTLLKGENRMYWIDHLSITDLECAEHLCSKIDIIIITLSITNK